MPRPRPQGTPLDELFNYRTITHNISDPNKNRVDLIREKLENLIAEVRLDCNTTIEKYKNRWEELKENIKFQKMPKPENQSDRNPNGIEHFCRQKFEHIYWKAQQNNPVPLERYPSKKRPLKFDDQKIENPKHPGEPDPDIEKLHHKIGRIKYKFIRDLIDVWFRNLPESTKYKHLSTISIDDDTRFVCEQKIFQGQTFQIPKKYKTCREKASFVRNILSRPRTRLYPISEDGAVEKLHPDQTEYFATQNLPKSLHETTAGENCDSTRDGLK